MTGEDIARAYWEHSRRRDPMLPRWEGLAPDLRKNRAKVLRVDKPKAVPDGQLDIFGGEAA